MEKLIQLLHTLIQKVPFHTEAEQAEAVEQLRAAAGELGVSEGTVPPAPTDPNAPAPPTPAPDPGPVAEPVPPEEQTPPPTGVPDVQGVNAFSDDVPGSP